MKKSILLFALTGLFFTAQAQTNQNFKLPSKITLTLTDEEYLALFAKIDSAGTLLIKTSTLPSNEVTKFNNRWNTVLFPFTNQIRIKLILADTTKKLPVVVKKGGK